MMNDKEIEIEIDNNMTDVIEIDDNMIEIDDDIVEMIDDEVIWMY